MSGYRNREAPTKANVNIKHERDMRT